MVWEDLKPRDVVTAAAVDNAITTVLALGGSTNAVVHMVALARRAGVPLTIDRFDALARRTPLVANIRPAGKYLMEDFYYAGGLRALLAEIGDLLDARRAHGQRQVAAAKTSPAPKSSTPTSSCRATRRWSRSDSLAVLRGNLAPDGAVIKPAAAEAHLLAHTGPAVVFADYNDMAARIDDPALARHEGFGARAPERGTAGRARDAGVGPAAHSQEAPRRRACATWCASPTRG